ncbi:Brix domain-containing protein [Dichotomocladium elegans]|nr:Brix domain-containing protein [Dichotomocladium elegans]
MWIDYCSRVEQEAKLTESDFIQLCGRIKKEDGQGIESIKCLQAVLREIHRRGMPRDTFVQGCNMLIHLFIQRRDLKSAKLVVDGMVRSNYKPNGVTVRTLIGGMMTIGCNLPDIHEFYDMLQKNRMWPEEPATYKLLISIFGSRGLIDSARIYFSTYLRKKLPLDESVFNMMMYAYKTAESPEGALAVYKQMLRRGAKPTPANYHLLITILKEANMIEEMNQVYADMRASGTQMNGSHLTAMGWNPKEAIKEMDKLEMPCSTRDFNSFIVYYTKKNQFADALDIFHVMQERDIQPDVFSYSIIMDALAKDHRQPVEAVFSLFEEMKSQGLHPDVPVYTTLMSACARSNDLDKAMGLLSEMEGYNLLPNTYTFNSILSLLSRRAMNGSDFKHAALLWNKMTELNIKPDTRSFNIYLSILSKSVRPLNDKPEGGLWKIDGTDAVQMSRPVKEMLHLYRSMRRTCKRDFLTYTVMINTLIDSGQLRQAMQVYNDAKVTRLRLPISVYNSMMKALEQSGQESQILNIWHDMKSVEVLPDNDSYTKAKNARSKRFLKNREAKVHENPKSTLFVKGSTTSQVVTDALKDLFSLKRANAAYFSKKNEIKPFEDETKIEFLSRKNDAAFLVVGTHSKKRPHNLTFVRMFDYQILDMFELGIEKGTFLSEIKGPKCSTGIKPLMIFNGERFDQDETYKSIKNYLLDLFNGEVTDFVNLAGLEYVMSWTAAPDNKILLRTYMVQLKKSGVKTPRVELEEMGPMLDMVVRRAEPSKPDLMKRALQMPKELKVMLYLWSSRMC